MQENVFKNYASFQSINWTVIVWFSIIDISWKATVFVFVLKSYTFVMCSDSFLLDDIFNKAKLISPSMKIALPPTREHTCDWLFVEFIDTKAEVSAVNVTWQLVNFSCSSFNSRKHERHVNDLTSASCTSRDINTGHNSTLYLIHNHTNI